MHFHSLISLAILGLATVTSCSPLRTSVQPRGTCAKLPTCLTGKTQTYCHRAASSGKKAKTASKKGPRALISRAAFEMNGPPQWTKLSSSSDFLRTGDIGGCSIVCIVSFSMAFGVHVSSGSTVNGVHQNDHDAMAATAINSLVTLWKQHSSGKGGDFKALVFSPDIGKDDSAAEKLVDGLDAAGIKAINWVQYSIPQFMKLPIADAAVEIRWAGAGQWPTLKTGGQCQTWEV